MPKKETFLQDKKVKKELEEQFTAEFELVEDELDTNRMWRMQLYVNWLENKLYDAQIDIIDRAKRS